MRPEATGYGLVYFVQNMLEEKGDSLKVRPCSYIWVPATSETP